MKQRYSSTSPYVRKVMVAAIEVGLEGQIEVVPTDPWDPETDLPDDNPLGKVPTLITKDGMTLLDSVVICEYLDSLHDGPPLISLSGEARWRALRWRVLGDGILDACQLRRVEDKIREKHMQSADWIARQKRTVERALAALESEASAIVKDPVTIGHISIGCALGYLDLRFADDDWRKDRPALDAWFEGFSQRPSMTETAPPA